MDKRTFTKRHLVFALAAVVLLLFVVAEFRTAVKPRIAIVAHDRAMPYLVVRKNALPITDAGALAKRLPKRDQAAVEALGLSKAVEMPKMVAGFSGKGDPFLSTIAPRPSKVAAMAGAQLKIAMQSSSGFLKPRRSVSQRVSDMALKIISAFPSFGISAAIADDRLFAKLPSPQIKQRELVEAEQQGEKSISYELAPGVQVFAQATPLTVYTDIVITNRSAVNPGKPVEFVLELADVTPWESHDGTIFFIKKGDYIPKVSKFKGLKVQTPSRWAFAMPHDVVFDADGKMGRVERKLKRMSKVQCQQSNDSACEVWLLRLYIDPQFLARAAFPLTIDPHVTSSGNTRTFDGGAACSGTEIWNDATNWSADTLPTTGDAVVFDGTCNTAVTGDTVADNLLSVTFTTSTYTATTTINANAISGGANSGMTWNIGTLNISGGTLAFNASTTMDSISGGAVDGTGYTLILDVLNIGASGTVHVDQNGFAALQGPGAGANGCGAWGATAAAYGGRGGGTGGKFPIAYGSSTAPTSLGSGGGNDSCGGSGGAGGGAIKLDATGGTVTINGLVAANGGSVSDGSQAAGGSGGSIWIIASTFSGSGTIRANGGRGGPVLGGGGGGGRIRITWTTNSFSGAIQATGGTGTSNNQPSEPGTYSFPDNTNITVSSPIALAPGTYTIPTLIVTSSATLLLQGATSTDGIPGGPNDGTGVTINATDVTVASGSAISADYQGFGTNEGPGKGTNGCGGGGPGGAGYGGRGGSGDPNNGGVAYGSPNSPLSLGSGGGDNTCDSESSFGGGAIKIAVSGTLTLDGVISANGQDGSSGQSGGGSGGSIWIIASTFAGSGTIRANGGSYGGIGGGGGGGGRISLIFHQLTTPGTNPTVTATVGTGGTGGQNGTTVYPVRLRGNVTVRGGVTFR